LKHGYSERARDAECRKDLLEVFDAVVGGRQRIDGLSGGTALPHPVARVAPRTGNRSSEINTVRSFHRCNTMTLGAGATIVDQGSPSRRQFAIKQMLYPPRVGGQRVEGGEL